jgi:hypothetical protein
MEKTRRELFELVWSMPMTKLSKQSELAFPRICRDFPLRGLRLPLKPIDCVYSPPEAEEHRYQKFANT